jgi:death-on-curing protein
MNPPYVYISIDDAIKSHGKTIEVSGGGLLGQVNIGQLEGVLEHIQNDDYYPTFDAKLTHVFFCACKFHCFSDGNKRIAIVLCAHMLLLNGYLGCLKEFFLEAENISYHVAAGRIDKDLLGKWMRAVLRGELENETLKLEILDAITRDDQ